MNPRLRTRTLWAAYVLTPVACRAVDSFLPITGLNWTPIANCSARVVTLPSEGGVHGISFSLSGFSTDGPSAEYSIGVNGVLQGADLPPGPFHFKLNAEATNPAGTAFQIASLLPEVKVGQIRSNSVVVIFDGPVGPGGGGAYGNHVARILEGRGLWVLDLGLVAGQPVQLGAAVALQASSALGNPRLNWTATLEFESVTPPRPPLISVHIRKVADETTLEWLSSSDRTFRVENTGDLQTWTPAEGKLGHLGGTNTWMSKPTAAAQFYRVVQLPQPPLITANNWLECPRAECPVAVPHQK